MESRWWIQNAFYQQDLQSHVEMRWFLESSNCGLFMNFLCNFTFSLLIYHSMILRKPKNDTNELISYSLARENVFMVIALLDFQMDWKNNSKSALEKAEKYSNSEQFIRRKMLWNHTSDELAICSLSSVCIFYASRGTFQLLFWQPLNIERPKR
jgi:hypothetical protein